MKKLMIGIATFAAATVLFAVVGDIISLGPSGEFRVDSSGVLRCASIVGDVTGDLTGDVTGDLTGDVTGDVAGVVIETATSRNVTNGQAVVLVAGVNILNGVGGANDTTNTVTIAATGTADLYKTYEIHVAGGSTNLIALADSGNLKLSAAWLGDEYDNIKLRATGSNVLSQVSVTNN